MYGIFSYIYHKNQPNVAKYTFRPMDPVGHNPKRPRQILIIHSKKITTHP